MEYIFGYSPIPTKHDYVRLMIQNIIFYSNYDDVVNAAADDDDILLYIIYNLKKYVSHKIYILAIEIKIILKL